MDHAVADSSFEDISTALEGYRQASDVLDEARQALYGSVRAAVASGHPKARVATAAGISREMLYRIIN